MNDYSCLPDEPCIHCDSTLFWLDGAAWQCAHCLPAPVPDPITLRLNLFRTVRPRAVDTSGVNAIPGGATPVRSSCPVS